MLLVTEDGVVAARRECLIFARRLEKPPVQVARIAHDVVPPASRRVAGMPEALDPPHRLTPAPESRERPRPDAEPPDLRPAEPPEEDRSRRLRREGEHDRDTTRPSLLLVSPLERLEDSLPTSLGGGRRVH